MSGPSASRPLLTYAESMTGDPLEAPMTRTKDRRAWQIGTASEVAWITNDTRVGRTIDSAIPPEFDAYATIVLPHPEDGLDPPEREIGWDQYIAEWNQTAPARHERALLQVLREEPGDPLWWLGYLDTGSADTVFPGAPMVSAYQGWSYVLIAAGLEQAATWRKRGWNMALPDLIFPADHSWLVSTLWDDDWTCVGGTDRLVSGFLNHPLLGARTRRVSIKEDATPPGHEAH
jgi:hypothetical protein